MLPYDIATKDICRGDDEPALLRNYPLRDKVLDLGPDELVFVGPVFDSQLVDDPNRQQNDCIRPQAVRPVEGRSVI